jgi:hypothetical protein
MDSSGTDRNAVAEPVSIPRIDAAEWGVFFVWVGVTLLANVGWGIALLGTGVIWLRIQLSRRLLALAVDPWSVGLGGCLVVAGLLQWLEVPSDQAPMPTWAFPAAFVALGIAIVVWISTRRIRPS